MREIINESGIQRGAVAITQIRSSMRLILLYLVVAISAFGCFFAEDEEDSAYGDVDDCECYVDE